MSNNAENRVAEIVLGMVETIEAAINRCDLPPQGIDIEDRWSQYRDELREMATYDAETWPYAQAMQDYKPTHLHRVYTKLRDIIRNAAEEAARA